MHGPTADNLQPVFDQWIKIKVLFIYIYVYIYIICVCGCVYVYPVYVFFLVTLNIAITALSKHEWHDTASSTIVCNTVSMLR